MVCIACTPWSKPPPLCIIYSSQTLVSIRSLSSYSAGQWVIWQHIRYTFLLKWLFVLHRFGNFLFLSGFFLIHRDNFFWFHFFSGLSSFSFAPAEYFPSPGGGGWRGGWWRNWIRHPEWPSIAITSRNNTKPFKRSTKRSLNYFRYCSRCPNILRLGDFRSESSNFLTHTLLFVFRPCQRDLDLFVLTYMVKF